MKSLYIVGAGGLGREVLSWALDIQRRSQPDWRLAGFLDQNKDALTDFSLPVGVVGDPGSFVPSPNDVLVCAVGDPTVKLKLCDDLEERGARFVSLVHPTVVMGMNCTVGEGSILCPNVVLTTNVSVGKHVLVNVSATLGHDVTVGEGCTINSHCDITGHAVLERGVFLGSRASILPKARVGEFAKVGAGSVVLKKVVPHTTVFGIPARKIPRMS
ncbi:MAG: acetyltransferase [Deltaproteobacteria bacterium]|nr:MAG: acetyltransferase [Deltaproteobacteria bacterium]